MTPIQVLTEAKARGPRVFRDWWMLSQNNDVANPAYRAVMQAAAHIGFRDAGYLMDWLELHPDPKIFEEAILILQREVL